MKKFLITALLLPSMCLGAPFDLLINQRNIADSATALRTIPLPATGVYNILGTDSGTNFPSVFKLSQPFGVINGELVVSLVWNDILNKPVFSTVATSGNYNDLSNKPSNAPQINSDWTATSGAEEILNKPMLFSGGYADLTGKPALATIATSGAYSDLSGKPTLTNGTITSITAGTGLSGGAITTSGTISMPNTGTAGSYSGVTTDAQGRVTTGTNKAQASSSRALNTAFQISTTRDADVRYSVQCTITASISGGQACDVILEIASDSGFTSNVQTLGIGGGGQTYTLAIALQGVTLLTGQVSGYVPAGYYARVRTVNVTGSPTYLMRAGQEVLQ